MLGGNKVTVILREHCSLPNLTEGKTALKKQIVCRYVWGSPEVLHANVRAWWNVWEVSFIWGPEGIIGVPPLVPQAICYGI